MRTYLEVIERQANQMFSNYMGGSNELRVGDTSLMQFIYGPPAKQIELQIMKEYERVKAEYYKKVNK